MDLFKQLQEKFPDTEFRISPRKPSKVQRKIGNVWTSICEHNRRPNECKECGGIGICPHNKRRHECKDCDGKSICKHKKMRNVCTSCGGSALCIHKRQRNYCIDCTGASICQHKKQRGQCKECKGANICQHGKHRPHCRDCCGSSFCVHQRQRQHCKDCGGASICTHGKTKYYCTECGGKGICEHKKRKHTCKICHGASICEHNLYRQYCKHCRGSKVCQCGEGFKVKDSLCTHCLKCKTDGCVGTPSCVYYYEYCFACGCFKNGETPQKKRQDNVFHFIGENFGISEIRYDRPVPDQQCTKFRPDVFFTLPHRKLVVECDENSHKASQYDCETKRMSELASSGEILPTVFIRFNPDLYRSPDGRKMKIPMEKRLQTLKEEIDLWLDVSTQQDHYFTVVYLFYDGCEQREVDFIPCDWEEQSNANSETTQE